jgi:predicted acyl esterase
MKSHRVSFGMSLATLMMFSAMAPADDVVLLPSGTFTYPPVERYMVPMSDGIQLATDVYYPQSGDGPWPVFLYRTPYNIENDNVDHYAEDGWVAVCQDTRGRFASEGIDQMFRDDGWGPDHRDGLETVEWILTQPWCSGDIAGGGRSATGITQYQLAGALPPAYRAMLAVMAPASCYHHMVFPGGAFRERDMLTWFALQGNEYMLDSLAAHPNYDEWWIWIDSTSRDSLITVPGYHRGGWYDLFVEGTIANFSGLQWGGAPGALGNQKLMVAPYTHGPDQGELTYPPNASYHGGSALIGSSDDFFDYWARGEPNGVMDLPPIAYYQMGDVDDPGAPGNEWRATDSWPPPGAQCVLYLHAGGELSETLPAFSDPPETYDFDPLNPVPTRGGANGFGEQGPYDQNTVLDRPDVLVYTTPLLEEPVEIAGMVTVNLYASSNRVDTDFTAKLCDVYPDGRSMLVCDGILRGRHRISMASEDFLVPGQVYEFEIQLGNTAISFAPGHQIRLAISSSNWDRFDVNPNTGQPWGQNDTTLVASNIVYQDAARPSQLVLWVTGDVTAVAADPSESPGVTLSTNYPNPFTSVTTIRYVLPDADHVRVRVFDTRGRLVRVLVDGDQGPGPNLVSWDGFNLHGLEVADGVYFYNLEMGGRFESRRMVLSR